MRPLIAATLLSALVTGATGSAVPGGPYYAMVNRYDHSNFRDGFEFYSGTANRTGQTITRFVSEEEAFEQGLIWAEDGEFFFGVDMRQVVGDGKGRPSIRLQSKNFYGNGLFIADFSHLPRKMCGVTSTFSTSGRNPPDDGQIRLYNTQEELIANRPSFLTGLESKVGSCALTDYSTIDASISDPICNIKEPTYLGNPRGDKGCHTFMAIGPDGNDDGGVFALIRTDDYIRLYTWKHADAPADVFTNNPDPSSWTGNPTMEIWERPCKLRHQFAAQRLVLDIEFCTRWEGRYAREWYSSNCGIETDTHTCEAFVRQSPNKFDGVYWGVRDIRIFTPKGRKAPKDETRELTVVKVVTSYETVMTPGPVEYVTGGIGFSQDSTVTMTKIETWTRWSTKTSITTETSTTTETWTETETSTRWRKKTETSTMTETSTTTETWTETETSTRWRRKTETSTMTETSICPPPPRQTYFPGCPDCADVQANNRMRPVVILDLPVTPVAPDDNPDQPLTNAIRTITTVTVTATETVAATCDPLPVDSADDQSRRAAAGRAGRQVQADTGLGLQAGSRAASTRDSLSLAATTTETETETETKTETETETETKTATRTLTLACAPSLPETPDGDLSKTVYEDERSVYNGETTYEPAQTAGLGRDRAEYRGGGGGGGGRDGSVARLQKEVELDFGSSDAGQTSTGRSTASCSDTVATKTITRTERTTETMTMTTTQFALWQDDDEEDCE